MNTLYHGMEARYRGLNLTGFLLSLAALVFAVGYLQQTLGLEPCPLCVLSRLLVLACGALFLLAFLHNPRRTGQRIYAALIGLHALLGIGVNLRHIWLQNLPRSEVPECGPGIDYLLQNFPLHRALEVILNGSGECAEIQWQLAGLTLPQQTLILFTLLLLIAFIQFRKKQRTYFR